MAKYTYELLPLEQRHNFYKKKSIGSNLLYVYQYATSRGN
jgi:hypothetical protein